MICVEWAGDHFGLVLTLIDPLVDEDMREKTIFTFSFSVTLTFDL